MAFGQSALAAFLAQGVTKRVTYLAERTQGVSVETADIRSDEYANAAAAAAGTATATLTFDPVGLAGTAAIVAASEHDLALKKKGEA